eukprot:TRINITY_DN123549_c0_g1_i1.p2 TRINITY_DN123549_c0_g1~~TRINITY_DN123549_c0_g1_i1.p2  ORF type:complete len:369 (-),score=93.22 TRINITY_DN123549_c0_g1_i1:61-1167(-)
MQLHHLLAAVENGANASSVVFVLPNSSLGVAAVDDAVLQASAGVLQCASGATFDSILNLVAEGRVEQAEPCQVEAIQLLLLLGSLLTALFAVFCMLSHIHEDRTELLMPLAPGLLVKQPVLLFRMPLDSPDMDSFEVLDKGDQVLCKVTMSWADPFRKEPNDMLGVAYVHDSRDIALGMVVAKGGKTPGSGVQIGIRRVLTENFAKIDVAGPKLLHVRHRTNAMLLTLLGDFTPDATDIEGLNEGGTKVFSMRRLGDECMCKVMQNVDAGLVICSVLGARMHRRLTSPQPFPPRLLSAPTTPTGIQREVLLEGAAEQSQEAGCGAGSVSGSPSSKARGEDAAPVEEEVKAAAERVQEGPESRRSDESL